MNFDIISQVLLAVFGVTAIFISQSPDKNTSRYACLLGMASQPFWFYTTAKAGQWGIFILCMFYAFAWARGIWNNWLKPFLDERKRIKEEKIDQIRALAYQYFINSGVDKK